ncbi:radical SAM protein, partial [Escherichia coli]
MHVTAKPSSFQCNLKCDYCFYLEKESQFTHEKWMDDSTLKEFIKQYIAASGNQVYFTWQGGEPTLAGLDFFRKVIHYQQRYAGQKRIVNALQTNGILLNNEWCAFLKEHEFLVGISIDGPQELHDRYRRSNSGNGTFAKVIAAIERLKSYQIEFNTLTVINNINVHYPLEVYHFLKSIGSKHMQFIELLETGTPNIDFSGHSENTFRIIDFSVP